jgi:hypothetical protein
MTSTRLDDDKKKKRERGKGHELITPCDAVYKKHNATALNLMHATYTTYERASRAAAVVTSPAVPAAA